MKNKVQPILVPIILILLGIAIILVFFLNPKLLVLIILLVAKLFDNMESLKFLILLVLFVSWLIVQLVTGKTTLGHGGVASRKESPGLYWLAVFVWTIPILLLIWEINLKEIFEYQSKILVGIVSFLFVWLVAIFYLIKKYIIKRRLTSNSS